MNIFIATIEGTEAILTSEESWHCCKVLRKKAGEAVNLIDGKGNFFEGVLSLVSEKQCRAKITGGPVLQPKKNYHLHLAIAPTKQIDRIEWMLEKAVEIGIHEISFMVCKNSERTVVKPERMNKIIESAVKQSLQAYLPKNNCTVLFKDLLNLSASHRFIAHCFDSPKKDLKTIDFTNSSALVLIGPEGDFTKEEIALAESNAFEGLTLGPNRLRSETAGLYVCQALSLLA